MNKSFLTKHFSSLTLVVSIASSLVLAGAKLGFLKELPGCGVGSGCDLVTNGTWGSLPIVGWPVSFVGVAWFSSLLAIWLKWGFSKELLAITRVGVLGSLFFVGIMISKETFCKYCVVAHVGNILFWAILEKTTTVQGGEEENKKSVGWPTGNIGLLFGVFVPIFIGLSVSLGAINYWVEKNTVEKNRLAAEENEQKIVGGVADISTLKKLKAKHKIGFDSAPIQITMFTDYQCPDCRRIEKQLSAIVKSRGDICVSVKHFPMCYHCNENIGSFNLHANACWAARAAEAASIVGGEEGWEKMHNWLFENRGVFTDSDFPQSLLSLGFEPNSFVEVMKSNETLDRVKADANDGFALGLYFTPMIFINGVEYLWYYGGTESLNSIINQVAAKGGSGVVAPPSAKEKLVEDWRRGKKHKSRFTEHVSWLGGGETEVVVWGDYQSAFSVELDGIVQSMLKNNPQIKYTFRHFPIDSECNGRSGNFNSEMEGSCFLARIVEAVHVLGDGKKRWAMHNWIVKNQTTLQEPLVLAKAAQITSVNQKVIQDVMGSIEVNDRIQKDIIVKQGVWPRDVPVVIVDGRHIPRWRADGYPANELLQRVFDIVASESSSR